MSTDTETVSQPESSPTDRIDHDLRLIMGDPERIMAAERGGHTEGDEFVSPTPPRLDAEKPLAIPGEDGKSLAEFRTVRDPVTEGPLVIISLAAPDGGLETYNYTIATGEVGHVPSSLLDPVLEGAAAQEALAATLDGLAKRWQDLYGTLDVA